MKVRVNACYYFYPVFFDKVEIGWRRAGLHEGQKVRVINLFGCPKANTMGMCYIVPADAKKDDRGHWDKDFAMVMTGSLSREQLNPEPKKTEAIKA